MKLKSFLRSFIFLIPLILVFSKAIAEPTFVQSKSIDTADNYYGLTFNNDGTKMYTLKSHTTTDAVIEHILTTAYDISTATVNNTKVVHLSGGNLSHVPTQVVFNNDGTKMFIAVSYTHLRAHETSLHLVCRLLLEKKNSNLPPFCQIRNIRSYS